MTKTKRSWVAGSLALLGACADGAAPNPDPDSWDPEPSARIAADVPAGQVRVRIMAGNLTTGSYQAYEDPGIRIFRGLQPDVALIQELNFKTDSDADLRSFVDQAFGPEFSFVRGPSAEQIPNGVISRYPILDSGEWHDTQVTNRGFEWARIDVPGPVDLYAISVHLLGSDMTKRQTQAAELVQYIQGLPAGAYVVLGGDFNTGARAEPCVTTLAAVLATDGPYPVDESGNENTNAARAKPYDWVLGNPALTAKAMPVVVGGETFSSGLVADTRVYTPIADLAPALAGDSGAPSMQHMGVVRDFALPADVAATVTVTAPNGGETWIGGSSHDLTWTAAGVDSVEVEVTLDGTTWQTVSASTPAAAGSLSWTVPATATAAARVRLSAVPGGSPSDVSDAPFNITVAARPGQVFINEILANEPGADTSAEFVELVNAGDAAVDLSGWKLSDSVTVRHVFPAGTVLAGHAAAVVYGRTASSRSLSLTNSGDTVTLANAQGTVDRVSYTSTLASVDAVSMNRRPDGDPAGSFVLHTTLSGQPSSPGTRVDGSGFGSGTAPPPPPAISAETEPNDVPGSASGPVGAPAVAASIASSTDVDWYRFTTAGGTVTISVTAATGVDLDWYLYEAGDPTTVVARGYTVNNPETGNYSAAAGTYLLRVNGYRGVTAPYTLRVVAP